MSISGHHTRSSRSGQVTNRSLLSSNNSSTPTPSKNGLSQNSKASNAYILTENSDGQLQLANRFSSSEDEEKLKSRDAIRQKSREIHQKLHKNGGKTSKKGSEKKAEMVSELSQAPNSDMDVKVGTNGSSKVSEKRIKYITLCPAHRSLCGKESSAVEICQKLFGIIVFEYNNGKGSQQNINKDRKLVVQGVVYGSEAFQSGVISRGDMLIRINDVDVSWRNFIQLLKTLNKREKVRLTFQSPKIIGPRSPYTVIQVPEADLCVAAVGWPLDHIQAELSQLNCVALYLTLVPSSSQADADMMEDVVYVFPPGEEAFTALRGLFITLSSALVDVVQKTAVGSHLLLNGVKVNVGYRQCGKDVFVIALPGDRVSPEVVDSVLSSLTALLVLLFGDVQSAFRDCDRVWMDKLMALTFYRAMSLPSNMRQCGPDCYPMLCSLFSSDCWSVRHLDMSSENKLLCDEILHEFESMDFDDFLDKEELFSRRKYNIRGTSLYYKEFLLTSHLPYDIQRDVNLFINYHELLSMSSRQPVSQILIWHEIKSYANADDLSTLPVGYRPLVTRSFIMVIGLHHFCLAVLVDACLSSSQGQNYEQARPLPLLVEQGRTTLEQLETEEVHMSRCCEESLSDTRLGVSLTCPDLLTISYSPRGRLNSRESRTINGHNRQPLTPSKSVSEGYFISRSKSSERSDEREFASHHERYGSKLSYGSNDSGGSGSSGPSKGKGSRLSSITDLSNISRGVSVLSLTEGIPAAARLTRGRDNCLFFFVNLDIGSGVLVAPTDTQLLEQHSALQAQVLHNFALACRKLITLLRNSALASEDIKKTKTVMSSPTISEEESCVWEAGTLFSCTVTSTQDKRQVSTLEYWVQGRMIKTDNQSRLLFVCFHESADQCLVETAFSLGFGA